MRPDEKYMSQITIDDSDINFIPPSFSKSLFRNEFPNTKNNTNNSNNNSLNLFPSETKSSQLYCYYSSFNDCAEKNNNNNIIPSMRMPTPSEILRDFDLDLDETEDFERNDSTNDVDRIYLEMQKNNPGIFTTFSAYGIPSPITKVIIKRSIKLSLNYYNKK